MTQSHGALQLLSVCRLVKTQLFGRMLHSGDVFLHGLKTILQTTIMDAFETRIEWKPRILGVLRRIEAHVGNVDFGGVNPDELHFGETSVVDDVSVLACPNALGAQAVS